MSKSCFRLAHALGQDVADVLVRLNPLVHRNLWRVILLLELLVLHLLLLEQELLLLLLLHHSLLEYLLELQLDLLWKWLDWVAILVEHVLICFTVLRDVLSILQKLDDLLC